MSYRDLVKHWHNGVQAVENGDLDLALQNFFTIEEPVSKIWYNIGCVHILKGNLENALEAYNQALVKDPCLAVGFFQRCYVHFQLGRYEEALSDCQLALAQLRNNSFIDYKQLGLRHLLYAWEILYNMAAVLCWLGNWEAALEKLHEAIRGLPKESESAKLDLAVNEVQKQVLFQPLRVSEAEIFRPRKQEVEQLICKDFLGKPKVITSVVPNDEYCGFEPLRPQMPGFYEPCKEDMQDQQAGYHRVSAHYYPDKSGEVAVKASSILYVLKKHGDWATAIHDGLKIVIPTSYLKPVAAPKADITKISNGIPLPPTKMPPTRPNTGNISAALDVPPRPTTDSPELKQKSKRLSDIGETSIEHHAAASHARGRRFSDGSFHSATIARLTPLRSARVLKPPETVIKEAAPTMLMPKMEMALSLQSSPSSPKTTQDISVDPQAFICETEPVSGEDDLITLQVRTEFTVDLPVRTNITYTELEHLLRDKFRKQGEKMNIQLSYRDSEGKQVTPLKEDGDLKRMWGHARQRKLMLCCKDMESISGPILYRMKAVYRYLGDGPEDLSLNYNDLIDVLSEVNDEWLEGHCNGRIGIFPKCYATKLSE
ncbi:NADPH oxidase activator 1 [Gastrophryne carolinensis]